MTIELMDKPGQLLAVSRVIAEHGGNVIEVHHEHSRGGSDVNGCYLRVTMETRNFEHINEIRRSLAEQGLRVIE